MKKRNQKSSRDWLPFDKIYDNGIIFSENSYVKILKIKPINYDLKSDLEKEMILNSYKNFLKICDFDIQILIQSKRENISKTISQLKNIEENNYKILNIRDEYIKYLTLTNEEKKSSSKNFYIIIKKKINLSRRKKNDLEKINEKEIDYLNECYFKAKETLGRCGNYVSEISNKDEVIKIISSFLK